MQHHEQMPLLPIASGEGAWLIDFDGKRYLDAISSWWVNWFGHANARINAALTDQLGKLEHVMLAGFTHEPVVQLSERLASLTGHGETQGALSALARGFLYSHSYTGNTLGLPCRTGGAGHFRGGSSAGTQPREIDRRNTGYLPLSTRLNSPTTFFSFGQRSAMTVLGRFAMPLLMLALQTPAIATTPMSDPPAPVAAALAQAGVPESSVGIYVHDLTNNRPIVAVGIDRSFNPASVIKLVTTFAALEILGPAYTWKTEAYVDGILNGDRLDGNLVLKGYGDPKLTLENFWLFVRDLRNRGLREISGDLVLDRSFFAIDNHDPAQFDNEPTRPYNVGADALLLNFKSFRLRFVPDEEKHAVAVYSEPVLPPVTVINNLYLAPGFCDIWPEKPTHDGNTLTFFGTFPSSCGEKSRSFSLLSADEYMAAVFGQMWLQGGGTWSGQVRAGQLPATARLLSTWESAALSESIRDINKFSNNVMARNVFLTLGAQDGRPATLEKSERAVSDWLTRRGMSFPDMRMDNGAGLSRTTRISARQLGALLIAAWNSPLMPEYVASLPLVAVDGTMRRRLSNSAVAGQAHVKSGYLEGVRANSGYVMDSRGRMLLIVFLINHPGARNAKAAQDALLEWVQEGYPGECCRPK